MIENLFCQIFIKFDGEIERLILLILEIVKGKLNQFTIENDICEIDVIENDEFENGNEDFLFWKYYLDIEPKENIQENTYVNTVCNLITDLKKEGIACVAACDFEDEIKQQIG